MRRSLRMKPAVILLVGSSLTLAGVSGAGARDEAAASKANADKRQ